MKLISASVFAGFLGVAVMAYGSSFVIDNFSCPDSVSVRYPAVTVSSLARVPLAENGKTSSSLSLVRAIR